MNNEDIARRLDTIIAILRLAHREAIEAARVTIREDEVSSAILDQTASWVQAGKLTEAVKSKTNQSRQTINRRINELLAMDALEKQGAGRLTEYRSTGLI